MYFCVPRECLIPLEIRSEHTVPLELEFTDGCETLCRS